MPTRRPVDDRSRRVQRHRNSIGRGPQLAKPFSDLVGPRTDPTTVCPRGGPPAFFAISAPVCSASAVAERTVGGGEHGRGSVVADGALTHAVHREGEGH